MLEYRIHVRPERFQSPEMSSLLSGFCDAVVEKDETDDSVKDVFGTQSLLRLGNRFYSVLSAHQLDKLASGIPKLVDAEKRLWLSPQSQIDFSRPASQLPEDELDLCVLDWTDHVRKGHLPENRFFAVGPGNILTAKDRVIVAPNPGYPLDIQEFSSSFDIEMIDGVEVPTYVTEGVTINGMINTLVPAERLDFEKQYHLWKQVYVVETNPNGRSGSPIFAFMREADTLVIKFAGIVFLGAYDKVNAYTGSIILGALRAAEGNLRTRKNEML